MPVRNNGKNLDNIRQRPGNLQVSIYDQPRPDIPVVDSHWAIVSLKTVSRITVSRKDIRSVLCMDAITHRCAML